MGVSVSGADCLLLVHAEKVADPESELVCNGRHESFVLEAQGRVGRAIAAIDGLFAGSVTQPQDILYIDYNRGADRQAPTRTELTQEHWSAGPDGIVLATKTLRTAADRPELEALRTMRTDTPRGRLRQVVQAAGHLMQAADPSDEVWFGAVTFPLDASLLYSDDAFHNMRDSASARLAEDSARYVPHDGVSRVSEDQVSRLVAQMDPERVRVDAARLAAYRKVDNRLTEAELASMRGKVLHDRLLPLVRLDQDLAVAVARIEGGRRLRPRAARHQLARR